MARGRIGYAYGRALFYATGGVSVTDLKIQDSFSDNLNAATESNSVKGTKTSYVAGLGVEYKLQSAWTAKVEYLHFDFGGVSGTSSNLTASTPPGAFPSNTFTSSANLRADVVRVGMNYRF
jgi:outer membrane immunogenic protein